MRWFKRFFLVVLLTVLALPLRPSIKTMEEYKLKSIYLYQICKFTFWPGPAKLNQPFVISVLGTLPPDSAISIPGKTIGRRKLVIRHIQKLEQIKDSEVLFIASSEAHRIRTILEYVDGRNILTVGDTKGFAQKGVSINFVTVGKALRFEINRQAVNKSKLQMHSQLYTIGQVIKNKSGD